MYVLSCILCAPFVFFAHSVSAQSFDESTVETVASTTASSTDVAVQMYEYPSDGLPGGGAVVGDFVVGPGKVDLTIKPGESQTIEMLVSNRTGERRKFNITMEDAEGSTDTAVPIVLLGDDRGPYSLKDYVSVPAQSFELDHNKRARIPVTISIPKDAEPGGLYGSVLIDTVAIKGEEGNTNGTAPQSAIIARIGTLFFITVPGDVAREGSLKDFTTVPPKQFYTEGPVSFGILFENTGSMHLAPYGEIRVTNIFGDEVGFIELDPWFVFPKSLRLREVTWDREILFGRYTATLSVNRSYENIIDTKSYVFWMLPWKPLLGVFTAVFVVLFIFRAFFRRFEFKRKE